MLNMLLAFDNLNPMNWDVLKPSLNFLWQGMLAIFVVIGLIIIAVKIAAWAIVKCGEIKKRREQALQNMQDEENNS